MTYQKSATLDYFTYIHSRGLSKMGAYPSCKEYLFFNVRKYINWNIST